jgi:signal transduction histidine kinase
LLARSLRLERAPSIDPKLRQILDANVVRGLFLTATGVVLLDALLAVIVAFIFWNEVSSSTMVAWLALSLAVALVRWLHIERYFRAKSPTATSRSWARLFALGAFLSGLLWGVGNIAFYVPGNGLLLVVQVFLVTGLSACALAGYSAHLPSFYAFVIPMILPFGLCLGLDGTPAHLFTAALLAAWLSVLVFLAHLLNQHITDRLLLLDRAMLTEAMERSRDAAEAANRAKTRLLADVSHELRTPLNAIIGFSDAMSSELFGRHAVSRYREYSRDIKASGSHLLNLINDIVDAAKIESGHVTLNESVVRVQDLLEETRRMLRFGATSADVTLDIFAPKDLPPIRVDQLRLSQVLINLLSNAVKFSPAMSRVSVVATRDTGGDLLIRVKDNGIGMRKADIAKAMLPFVQLDQPPPRGDTGSGLGLAIARVLLEAHGGTLLLESELGVGTTATIRLPKERFLSPVPAQ